MSKACMVRLNSCRASADLSMLIVLVACSTEERFDTSTSTEEIGSLPCSSDICLQKKKKIARFADE